MGSSKVIGPSGRDVYAATVMVEDGSFYTFMVEAVSKEEATGFALDVAKFAEKEKSKQERKIVHWHVGIARDACWYTEV